MKKLLLISLGIFSCLDSFSAQALNFNASLLDDNLYTQNTLVPDALFGNDSYQIAKTYFLPDYQAKIVDRASDISKDTGGGDTDKSCSAYGFEACQAPKTLRPGASPVHPVQGLDCYKKSDCICPTGTDGYNYSSANCSGNKQPSGDTCNDLYKECICKDGFTYNSTNCKGEYQLAGDSCDDNYQRCDPKPCSDGGYSDKTIEGKICSAVTYGGQTCQACRDKTCEEKCSGFQTGVTCAKGQNTETCSSECSSYVKCTGEACPSGVGNCKYGCQTYSTQKDCTDVCLECEKCAPTCTNETDCPYGTETVDNGCGGTCTVCKVCVPSCTNETNCSYGTESVSNGCGGTCTKCKAATCEQSLIDAGYTPVKTRAEINLAHNDMVLMNDITDYYDNKDSSNNTVTIDGYNIYSPKYFSNLNPKCYGTTTLKGEFYHLGSTDVKVNLDTYEDSYIENPTYIYEKFFTTWLFLNADISYMSAGDYEISYGINVDNDSAGLNLSKGVNLFFDGDVNGDTYFHLQAESCLESNSEGFKICAVSDTHIDLKMTQAPYSSSVMPYKCGTSGITLKGRPHIHCKGSITTSCPSGSTAAMLSDQIACGNSLPIYSNLSNTVWCPTDYAESVFCKSGYIQTASPDYPGCYQCRTPMSAEIRQKCKTTYDTCLKSAKDFRTQKEQNSYKGWLKCRENAYNYTDQSDIDSALSDCDYDYDDDLTSWRIDYDNDVAECDANYENCLEVKTQPIENDQIVCMKCGVSVI